MSSDGIIGLNVGGIVYTTTKSTLLSNENECFFFRNLLSPKFQTLKDSSGNIFIDRDGKTFRYILNYLRSGALHVTEASVPQAGLVYRELLDEAMYFGLTQLSTELTMRIEAIEEDERAPKVDNVVSELQRLQRQLSNSKVEDPRVEVRAPPTPEPAHTFDLNVSF
jgi:hypothetical protein